MTQQTHKLAVLVATAQCRHHYVAVDLEWHKKQSSVGFNASPSCTAAVCGTRAGHSTVCHGVATVHWSSKAPRRSRK